jgi:hypothetical protein
MSEPEKPSGGEQSAGNEARDIEPLLRRLDQPSDVTRALLFCASLVSIGFVAAQNFELMTGWQAVLNGFAVLSFALSLTVVFLQWDMRPRASSSDASAPTGFRAYLAPIMSIGIVKRVCRQRFDRISFAFILIGVILVFAAKIWRMSDQTNV